MIANFASFPQFAGKGYKVVELAGDFEAWKSNRFEIDAL